MSLPSFPTSISLPSLPNRKSSPGPPAIPSFPELPLSVSLPAHPLNISLSPKPVITSLCNVPTSSSLPCVPLGFFLELSESVQTEDNNGRGGCSLFGIGYWVDFIFIVTKPVLVLSSPWLSVAWKINTSNTVNFLSGIEERIPLDSLKKEYCDTNLYIQKAKRAFLKIVDPQKYLLRLTGNSLLEFNLEIL